MSEPGAPAGDELSTRRAQREELAMMAAAERAAREQHLGFGVRDFVMCGLPLRRSKACSYRRQNGDFTLEMHAPAQHGLPYGQDRLMTIWLATAYFAAGKPANRVIRFRCASDILRAFGQDNGGEKLERLMARIKRIFYTTFYISWTSAAWKQDGAAARRLLERSYRLIREVNLTIDASSSRHTNQYTLWQDHIELDEGFVEDLQRGGRVPIDLETVRALKDAPGILDLYMWQAWRSYRMERDREAPASLPVFGEGGLVQHIGCDISSPRKLRQTLRHWQDEVRRVWQGCPNYLDVACERFYLNPGNAIASLQKIPELPGVSPTPPPLRAVGPSPGGSLVLVRDDEPRVDA